MGSFYATRRRAHKPRTIVEQLLFNESIGATARALYGDGGVL
jgi:hypothetical protein